MLKEELYFSTDVETDGPIPGPHSMLSFGTAVFNVEGEMLDTFTRNLETLDGAYPHPDTAKWWAKNQDAYDKTRIGLFHPQEAIVEYYKWINSFKCSPVFVAYPAGFDFTFIYWYLMRFVGHSPFSFSALDIKTLAMAKLGLTYRSSTKRNFPQEWFSKRKHTHVALDDAIEQGELFCNIMKWKKKHA